MSSSGVRAKTQVQTNARSDRTALEGRLSELDAKIGRALDLGIKMGDLEAAKVKLRELKVEREKVAAELTRLGRALPTVEEPEPLVQARLRDLRATLTADVALGRLALGALCSGTPGSGSTVTAGSRTPRPFV